MPIAEKLVDALKMFWQALDEEERRVVAYLAVYFTCSVVFALHKSSSERRRQQLIAELREEMTRGAAA
jgi:type II secretory pathway component PulM